MSDDVFTDPDDAESPASPDSARPPDDAWVDVRMTDPAEGEWNVDAVVVDGQVEYVDLQIRPDVLAGFVECLVDDVPRERAGRVLADVAASQDLDLPGETSTE